MREGEMLVAYEDRGKLRIEEIPKEETRMPVHPINLFESAIRILEKASQKRPDIQWTIVGGGPYGVHENP